MKKTIRRMWIAMLTAMIISVPVMAEIESDDKSKGEIESTWDGPVLNRVNGTVMGPSGKETYYNLDMSGVVSIMRGMGNTDEYKPNGMILSYPVITSGPFCHQGSIDTIIGKEPTKEMSDLVCLEKQVTADTVKTFIWHCADDGCVPPENTINFIRELSASHVSFECHIYPFGGHGLALSDHSTAAYDGHMNATCAEWFDLAVKWVFREI